MKMVSASSDGVLKYMGHKAKRVRWQPVERGDFSKSLYFATGSYDDKVNRIYLWKYNRNTTDNLELFNEPQEVSNIVVPSDVTDLLFLDNRLLFSTLANGSVVLLRNSNERLLKSYDWNKIHSGFSCNSITHYSHSPGTVLTGGEDGKIIMLTVGRPQPNQIIEGKDKTAITSLLSYYYSEVLVGNLSGQLKMWDLRMQPAKEPVKTFPIDSSEIVSVQCLNYHPHQPHLITAGCDNGVIAFLDIRQEKIPISLVQGHKKEVWETRFHSSSPDNLITCSQDGSLYHWASLNHYKSTTTTTTTSSDNIWLSSAIAKGNVDIKQLLPESNILSVNSFDVEKDCILAVTDGEALYVIPNTDFY